MRTLTLLSALSLVACVSDSVGPPDGGTSSDGSMSSDGTSATDGTATEGGDGGPTCPSTVKYEWHLGGPNLVNGVDAVAMDPMGNTYVTATYNGTPDLGKGTLPASGLSEMVVAKIDPMGKLVWSIPILSAQQELAGGIGIDGMGDVYVSGTSSGTSLRVAATMNAIALAGPSHSGFIAKLKASDGSFVWGKPVNSIGNGPNVFRVSCPALKVEGARVAVACTFASVSASFSGTQVNNADATGLTRDILVGVLDPTGNVVYARRLGGAPMSPATGDDVLGGIAVAPNGSVAVSATLWSQGPAFVGPNGNPTGPLVRIGNASATNAELVWIDPSGNLSRAQAFGNSTNTAAQDARGARVAFDPGSGDVYMTGSFRGTIEYGGGANGLAVGGQVGNGCGSNSMNCSDAFVARIDHATFGAVWHKEIGGTQDEDVDALTSDACGITVGGKNRSANVSIGGKAIESPSQAVTVGGPWGMWMARYAADGTIQWAKGLASSDPSAAVSSNGIATLGDRTRVGLGVQGSVKLDGVNVYTNPNQAQGFVVWGLQP